MASALEYSLNAYLIWPQEMEPVEETRAAFARAFRQVADFLSVQFGAPLQVNTEVAALWSRRSYQYHQDHAADINQVAMETLRAYGFPESGTVEARRYLYVVGVVGGGGFAGSYPPGAYYAGLAVVGDACLDLLTNGIFPGNERTCPLYTDPFVCTRDAQLGALADEMSHLFGVGPFHRTGNEYWRYPGITVNAEEREQVRSNSTPFFVGAPPPPTKPSLLELVLAFGPIAGLVAWGVRMRRRSWRR